MGTPKFSTFLMAIVWVSFFAAVFAPFISNTAINYGVTDESANITIFNKFSDLESNVSAIKDSFDYKEKTGIADIIGDFFSSGYQTLRLMLSSLDIFKVLLFDALSTSAFNIPSIDSLKTAIILTITILLLIGVILKALIKSDV